jgi:hypothetical protein
VINISTLTDAMMIAIQSTILNNDSLTQVIMQVLYQINIRKNLALKCLIDKYIPSRHKCRCIISAFEPTCSTLNVDVINPDMFYMIIRAVDQTWFDPRPCALSKKACSNVAYRTKISRIVSCLTEGYECIFTVFEGHMKVKYFEKQG